MTATLEVNVPDFFNLFEAKWNTKVCDICNEHFKRTAYGKHKKSNKSSTELFLKKSPQLMFSLKNEWVAINNHYEEIGCM